MATLMTIVVILLSLTNSITVSSSQRFCHKHRISNRRFKTLYSSPSSCKPTIVNSRPPEIRETKMCSQKTDCLEGEYCHPFQCLCLKPLESVTIAPLTTSTRKCKDNSNCKNQEYCHEMWKICLQTGKFFRNSPPERPSWYCESNKDCRLNQQCHKIFHACYKRPRAPTVRRSASNSRKCTHKSQCGHNYYCHEFFRICLPGTTTNKTTSNGRSNRSTTCHNDGDCRAGMMCHGLWKICFTPAQNLTVKLNTKRGCQHDSDCPKDKYCHVMGGQVRAVIARHRRNLHSICLPRYLIQIQKSQQRPKCSTDAECGPNKCCLEKLGICSSYQLPGDMCLLKKTAFACSCTIGSYCRPGGTSVSPKTIIIKMNLPQSTANYLKNGFRRMYKVGKCIPRPLNLNQTDTIK